MNLWICTTSLPALISAFQTASGSYKNLIITDKFFKVLTWTMAQALIVLQITNQCCSAQVCSWSVESASKIHQWQQESWAGQSLLWAVMWQPLLCHNAQLLMQLPSVDWKMKSEELVASCASKDQMTGWWRGSSCVCLSYIVPSVKTCEQLKDKPPVLKHQLQSSEQAESFSVLPKPPGSFRSRGIPFGFKRIWMRTEASCNEWVMLGN